MRHLMPYKADPSGQRRRGFTLVEILVVVLILGILAAMVIPQFSTATGDSKENALRMDLHRMRQVLALYHEQHDGRYPTDATTLRDQLTMATNELGETAAPGTPGYARGPYLVALPRNPFTSSDDVATTAVTGPGDATAWYYLDGKFHANDSVARYAY